MSRHGTPPAVDEGDPPWTLVALWRELAPAPGRFGNSLRITVLVLITVALAETFRIPEIAVSAYIVLFVSKSEQASTVTTAVAIGVTAVVAVFAVIIAFMASLSEPALRLPLIAAMTFAAMFLSRVSPLGPVLFGAGFIIAYGLTLGDEVIGLALQAGLVSNTTDVTLPQLAFMPPEDALLRFLLWLAVAVSIPAAVVVVGNLLTGRDPALLLRAALAARLAAAGSFCAGKPGALGTLTTLAREGTGELLRLTHLSRRPRARPTDAALVDAVGGLCLALLAAARAGWAGDERAAAVLREAEVAARTGGVLPDRPVRVPDAAGVARPVVAELARVLGAIRRALSVPPGGDATAPKPAKPVRHPLAADAWTNPAHARFALKVTLAMMLCYSIEDLTDWPSIHTCVITCFFVSLSTVGETLHKAALRLIGCLIGGALGIGTILLLMPWMTGLGDLLLVLASVTFLAAWVGTGSERIAYAGLQIGLAFYLAVLQGNGPTLDMETARDRLVGIAMGDVAVTAVFLSIWPVSVAQAVRGCLATALEQLALLLEQSEADAEARRAFGAAIARGRDMLRNDPYEAALTVRDQGRVDRATLLDVQALIVPVSVLLDLRTDPVWRDQPAEAQALMVAHNRAVAEWLRLCAIWARDGSGAEAVLAGPPPLESSSASGIGIGGSWATWLAILDGDIRGILDRVGPSPQPVQSATMQEPSLAAT